MIHIKSISSLPANIHELVQQSEQEGFVFVRRLELEWNNNRNRFNREGELFLAAFSNNKAVGICGVNIDPYTTETNIARLRHLYVSPAFRANAIGRKLVYDCLGNLHERFTVIRLRVPDAATGRFYQKLGFTPANDKDPTCSHIMRL